MATSQKEVRQLTNALERSDKYIEELEHKIRNESTQAKSKKNPRELNTNDEIDGSDLIATSSTHSHPFSISSAVNGFHTEASSSTSEMIHRNDSDMLPNAAPAKRVLFGKDFSQPKPSSSVPGAKQKQILFGKEFDVTPLETHHQNVTSSQSQKTASKASSVQYFLNGNLLQQQFEQDDQNSFQNTDEPDVKPRLGLFGKPLPPSPPPRETDHAERPNTGQRVVKKVQFKVPGERSGGTSGEQSGATSSSFELEMPSPLINVAEAKFQEKPNHHKRFNPKYSFPVGGKIPMYKSSEEKTADFEKNVQKLLGKSKALSESEPSSSSQRHIDNGVNDNNGVHDNNGVNDSSRLSLPDGNSDFDHLDISITPELNDCLQLMNRAEKNVQIPTPSTSSHPSSTSKEQPSQFTNILSSNFSNSNNNKAGPQKQQFSHRIPPSTFQNTPSMSGATGLTSSGTIWEKDFYSSVKANPYKFTHSAASSALHGMVVPKLEPPDTYDQPPPSQSYSTQQSTNSKHFASSLDMNIPSATAGFTSKKFNEISLVKTERKEELPPSFQTSQPNTTFHREHQLSTHQLPSFDSQELNSKRTLPFQSSSRTSHFRQNQSMDNSDLEWPDDFKWPDEIDGDRSEPPYKTTKR